MFRLIHPAMRITIYKRVQNIIKGLQCTLVQALRLCTGRTAHRGSRGIALPFHDHGTGRGEGSASSPGRSLPQNIITSKILINNWKQRVSVLRSCALRVLVPLTLNLLAPTTVGARINP